MKKTLFLQILMLSALIVNSQIPGALDCGSEALASSRPVSAALHKEEKMKHVPVAPAHIPAVLKLTIDGPGAMNDNAIVYLQEGASAEFDKAFDDRITRAKGSKMLFIAFEQGSNLIKANAISPKKVSSSYNIKTLTGISGHYTLSISGAERFMPNACITITDKQLSKTFEIKSLPYEFDLLDTTTLSRFILNIKFNSLKVESSITQPTCMFPKKGRIIVKGNLSEPLNYTWKLNGSIYKTLLRHIGPDSITDLSSGKLELEARSESGCDWFQSQYSLHAKKTPSADFLVKDTLLLSEASSVKLENNSLNSNFDMWIFNNESKPVTERSPVRTFNSPGNYTVTLMCSNSDECVNSVSKIITVLDDSMNFELIRQRATERFNKSVSNTLSVNIEIQNAAMKE